MDKDTIMQQIAAYLSEQHGMPVDQINADTKLMEEVILHSLAIVETVVFLEKTFGLSMERADINANNFETLSSLADLVGSKL